MFNRAAVVILAMVAAAATPAKECPLAGRWKSDAARTLADLATESRARPEAMNALSDDMFGHVNHVWTCSDLVAWLDGDEPGEPIAYRIVALNAESMLVTFPEGAESDLRVEFQGECYKIPFPGQEYHEYFCPFGE